MILHSQFHAANNTNLRGLVVVPGQLLAQPRRRDVQEAFVLADSNLVETCFGKGAIRS